jgi:hypothetical protein
MFLIENTLQNNFLRSQKVFIIGYLPVTWQPSVVSDSMAEAATLELLTHQRSSVLRLGPFLSKEAHCLHLFSER